MPDLNTTPPASLTTTRSAELFADAQKVIPGGVNSPVRAFKSVGGTPLFIRSAERRLYDGCRRKSIHRLRRIVGTDAIRAC
jgi:hypothetical protein